MNAKLVTATDRRVRSSSVARRAKPIDPDKDEMHLSFVVPTWVVQAADAEAERMTKQLRVPVSRTAVVRRWLEDAATKFAKK
jgi:hypothetical protein